MKYIWGKVCKVLWINKKINILLALEIVLGMTIFVYSANLYYSLENKQNELKQQTEDLELRISTIDLNVESLVFSMEDYQHLQEITNNRTRCHIDIPYSAAIDNQWYDFYIVLMDYEKERLEEGKIYWGEGLYPNRQDIEIESLSQFENAKLPERLNKYVIGNEDPMIRLKDCVVAPLSLMGQFEDDVTSASVHVLWNSNDFDNVEQMKQDVERYFQSLDRNNTVYEVYSPNVDLQNNTRKVRVSIQLLNKAGVLVLLVYFIGMLAIFQLLYERRVVSYGICEACGASKKKLINEIVLEIFILQFVGTLIGMAVGTFLTYCVDFGIMVGDIQVISDVRTYLYACIIGAGIVFVTSASLYRKLAHCTIISKIRSIEE